MDYLQTQINSTFGKHLTKVGFELSSAPGLKRELAKASRGSDYTKGDSQKLGAALAAYARGTSESVPYLITGTAYVSSITHDKKLNLYRAAVSLVRGSCWIVRPEAYLNPMRLAPMLWHLPSVGKRVLPLHWQELPNRWLGIKWFSNYLYRLEKTAEAGQGVQHSCLL